MSIIDSVAERAEAESRIATTDEATLRDDLVYWALATQGHQQEFNDLAGRQADVRLQWAESSTWVQLITEELAKRRPRRPA